MPDLICIVCPRGCKLHVENDVVTGNMCPRGIKYGLDEVNNPMRLFTSTVSVLNGMINRVPVKSDRYIPKNSVFDLINEIRKVEIKAPVYINQIIIENCLGLCNIIATRNIMKRG
ncbi:MAG: DUF1667 domain-containing protein [Bacilli bacterium]